MSGSLISTLSRIAAATSALRVRADDATRCEHNGGTSDAFRERIDVLITRLEQVADDLEAALA
jgi:hypothetical protein